MDDPLTGLAAALIVAGIVGIIGAVVMVKMGYGRPVYEAVSKASRAAIQSLTKRLRRKM